MDAATISATLVVAGFLGLVLSLGLMVMNRRLYARLAAIAGVLLICGGSLYPPGEKIKLGLDLQGGNSMTYEVDLTGVENPEQTMQQTIAVLQQRVDPDGLRNLGWSVEAGNRIVITMPLAGEKVVAAREAYQTALREIDESSLSRAEVLAALRSDPGERDGALAGLVRGVESRRDLLATASIASERVADARERLSAAGEPGSDAFIDAAGEVAEAEIALDDAVDAVMATNIDTGELRAVLGASTVARRAGETGEAVEDSSPRAVALGSMRAEHADRVGQIDALVSAYDAYQSVKGPLDDPEDLKRLLRGAGVLEFRIAVQGAGQLAALQSSGAPDSVALSEVEDLRRRLLERGPNSFGDEPMRWYVVDSPADFFNTSAESSESMISAVEDAESEEERDALVGAMFGGYIGEVFQGRPYVLLWNVEGRALTGDSGDWELTRAFPTQDGYGFPAVGFRFDTLGQNLFGALTSDAVGRNMAIVLDGRVYSAPRVNQAITGGSGVIEGGSGGFPQAELNYLTRTLSAGSLKARLSEEPISERNVSPSLGADNIAAGMESAIDAMIVVCIFMMIYYFFAGFVANVALLANLVLILGVLAMVQASFTLPGIAGIVLTIGMSVDANVLIFERIREELNRGAPMPTALRLGYEKAFSSIIDGNATNLIVCFVLYHTATADVKGFAVTLGIGIVATLFSALFLTRAVFDLYYRFVGENKKLSMLPSSVPAVERLLSPRYDWTGKRKMFYAFSGVLIAGSVVLCVMRGVELLDIEFRAGTEVEFNLKDGEVMTLSEARERIAGTALAGGGNISTQVVAVGDVDADFRASLFSVLTTESDSKVVTAEVREAFSGLIEIEPVLSFRGDDALDVADAPVYPITERSLGAVLNRPGITNEIPAEYLGGAAILLEEFSTPIPAERLASRIEEMRFQPDFEAMPYRRPLVIPLGVAADGGVASAVVLVGDDSVDYLRDPQRWESDLAGGEWELVKAALGRETSFSKVSTFDPQVARTLVYNAIVALGLSLIAIVAYIWFRFGSLRYGLAAIAALVHDVLLALGALAVCGLLYDSFLGPMLMLDAFKINMAMIAALLTIIGYSLNDTIVTFDRIRENRGKLAVASPGIINDSINQVISRSVLTSGTTMLAVLVLYVFGGPGVHGFAFAMMIGLVVGTYSSIAIASPLLLMGTKYAGYKGEKAVEKGDLGEK